MEILLIQTARQQVHLVCTLKARLNYQWKTVPASDSELAALPYRLEIRLLGQVAAAKTVLNPS